MGPRAKIAACLAVFLLLAANGAPREDSGGADYKNVVTLLETGQTVMGETIVYPQGAPARITSLIVTMAPGEETGRHKHPVPTYGFILDGELTVIYEGRGPRTYTKGQAFMEAEDVWHNGTNSGTSPARVLVVFMGADGIADVARPQ